MQNSHLSSDDRIAVVGITKELSVKMDPISVIELDAAPTNPVDAKVQDVHWRGYVKTKLFKYADRAQLEAGQPYEVLEDEGNILVNGGINLIWTLVAGGSGTPYNNTNAHIGVGNGTTTEDPVQTDLQGTSKVRKGMLQGYPVFGSDQKIVFQAQYNENEANFDWREWGVFNHPTAGTMLNRKVANSGTKASGAIWVFQVSITLS